eukprot:13442928-Alexandrium_andersonii.AAC.1
MPDYADDFDPVQARFPDGEVAKIEDVTIKYYKVIQGVAWSKRGALWTGIKGCEKGKVLEFLRKADRHELLTPKEKDAKGNRLSLVQLRVD